MEQRLDRLDTTISHQSQLVREDSASKDVRIRALTSDNELLTRQVFNQGKTIAKMQQRIGAQDVEKIRTVTGKVNPELSPESSHFKPAPGDSVLPSMEDFYSS